MCTARIVLQMKKGWSAPASAITSMLQQLQQAQKSSGVSNTSGAPVPQWNASLSGLANAEQQARTETLVVQRKEQTAAAAAAAAVASSNSNAQLPD